MLFISLSFSALSQIEKNDWMIGGSGRFMQQEILDEKIYVAELSANVGYFWHKNFVSGVSPAFIFSTNDYTYKGTIFTRYYYHFERVSPFVEINAGYSKRTVLWTDGEVNSQTESFVLGSKFGAAFFVAPNVSVDTYFFYDKSDNTTYYTTEGVNNTSVIITFLGVGAGFQIYF